MSDPFNPPDADEALRDAMEAWLGQARPDDDALIERVRHRVMALIGRDRPPPYCTVPASEEGWTEIGPGVTRKLLWATATAQSCLMRLAPGAAVPAHGHLIDEECLVLEGCVHIGPSLVLRAGDFHVARAGSSHEVTSTRTGALVYLRGAPDCNATA